MVAEYLLRWKMTTVGVIIMKTMEGLKTGTNSMSSSGIRVMKIIKRICLIIIFRIKVDLISLEAVQQVIKIILILILIRIISNLTEIAIEILIMVITEENHSDQGQEVQVEDNSVMKVHKIKNSIQMKKDHSEIATRLRNYKYKRETKLTLNVKLHIIHPPLGNSVKFSSVICPLQ